MKTEQALEVADQLLGLAINLLLDLQVVSDLITKAKQENRDLTGEEVDMVRQSRDTSLKQLKDLLG